MSLSASHGSYSRYDEGPFPCAKNISANSSTAERLPFLQDYSYYSIDEYCNALREDRHVVSFL